MRMHNNELDKIERIKTHIKNCIKDLKYMYRQGCRDPYDDRSDRYTAQSDILEELLIWIELEKDRH